VGNAIKPMYVERDTLRHFQGLLEDTAEYFCDENVMSGELFWTMVECFATAKLAELEGEVLPDIA
jgi:hypothetical protein